MTIYPRNAKAFLASVRRSLRLPILLVLGFALLSTAAHAQGNANIGGTVTDASGAVVPNSKVTVTDANNGFVHTTVANGSGNYSVPARSEEHTSELQSLRHLV